MTASEIGVEVPKLLPLVCSYIVAANLEPIIFYICEFRPLSVVPCKATGPQTPSVK